MIEFAAHIEINESTGEISLELSDGTVHHFDKAPFRQLGKEELQFDPDTFRGFWDCSKKYSMNN